MNETPDPPTEQDASPTGITRPSRPPVATRVRQSRIARLGIGLALLALILLVLAFALARLLGPAQRFEAFTLPYVEDFSDVDLSRWFRADGMWSLRDETLAQTTNLDKPAQIFIPQRLAADEPYHFSTYVTMAKNTRAAGVNFNAQYPELTQKLHRVTINRREDGGEELVAGYTDQEGEFVKQVEMPFDAGADDYRLDVYAANGTYTVQVNGQTLIDRRPLFYEGGLAGFYSLGPVRFDTVKITTAEAEPPGEQVYVSDFDQAPGGAGWVPFGGEWEISQGEMVQANPAAQDAGIGYEGSAFENFVLQASLRHLIGVGGGVLFNMPSPYQTNGAHMVRYSDQTDALFWGFFDDAGVFNRQGFLEMPAPGSEPHQLRVYSGERSYDVFVDDKLVARDVPLQRTNGHIGLITSLSSVAYSLVEVFPLFGGTPVAVIRPGQTEPAPTAAPEKPSPTPPPAPAGTAVVKAPDAGAPLAAGDRIVVRGGASPWTGAFRGDVRGAGWRPISGDWRFANGALVQENAAGFDQSIVYTGNAFRDFSLESSFRHLQGNGAGLLFNMPYTDRLNGAHMVRFSDRRPGGIFWGYYDQQGKFVGQGYANVDPPGTEPHNLRVVSGDATYSIYLDGALLADNLPLDDAQSFGYIGLITAQSAAAYEAIKVDGAEASRPAGATPAPAFSQPLSAAGVYGGREGFADQRIVGGRWETADGVFTQTAPESADYILNTGLYASDYTIEADVTLPDKPDAGGGLILHMPERSRKSGATVVRFIRGGEGVFWGVYDETGAFRGVGSAEVPDSTGSAHRLKVVVRGNRMDVYVDDQPVAAEVRLPQAEGWIGLLAFGGPVTIANVTATVGLGQ